MEHVIQCLEWLPDVARESWEQARGGHNVHGPRANIDDCSAHQRRLRRLPR